MKEKKYKCSLCGESVIPAKIGNVSGRHWNHEYVGDYEKCREQSGCPNIFSIRQNRIYHHRMKAVEDDRPEKKEPPNEMIVWKK